LKKLKSHLTCVRWLFFVVKTIDKKEIYRVDTDFGMALALQALFGHCRK